jgi:hypothetical protein
MIYQNKICGFLLQSSYNSFYSLQNYVSKNNHPSFQNSFLWAIPSHIIMVQKQQEFKIQTNNVPWSIPILNALLIQTKYSSYPFNITPSALWIPSPKSL